MGKCKKKVNPTYPKDIIEVRKIIFSNKRMVSEITDKVILKYIEADAAFTIGLTKDLVNKFSSRKLIKEFVESGGACISPDCIPKYTFMFTDVLDIFHTFDGLHLAGLSCFGECLDLVLGQHFRIFVCECLDAYDTSCSDQVIKTLTEEVYNRHKKSVMKLSRELYDILLEQGYADSMDELFLLFYDNIDDIHYEMPEMAPYGVSYKEILHKFLAYFDDCMADILKDKLRELDTIKEEEPREKTVYNYIPSYKELNSLAISNGFKYDRANGDHGIFENDLGRVVVIPQGRDVGKGLSIVIQKSIMGENS